MLLQHSFFWTFLEQPDIILCLEECNMNDQVSNLSVRFSSQADVERIAKFYYNNQHPQVDPISDKELVLLAESGRFLLFSDNEGEVKAASAAKTRAVYDQSEEKLLTWTEIGATMSVVHGFNLYPFIISSQVIHEHVKNPPTEFFYATIYNNNPAVISLLEKKVGWTVEPSSYDILAITDEVDLTNKITALTVSDNAIAKQADIVKKVIESPVLTSKKSEAKLALDLNDFSLSQEYKCNVDRLCKLNGNHRTFELSGKPEEIKPVVYVRSFT